MALLSNVRYRRGSWLLESLAVLAAVGSLAACGNQAVAKSVGAAASASPISVAPPSPTTSTSTPPSPATVTGAVAVWLSTADVPSGMTGMALPSGQMLGGTEATIIYSSLSAQDLITTTAFVFQNVSDAQSRLAYLLQTQPNGTPESQHPGLGQESHLYVAADQTVMVIWRDRTIVCMLVTSGLTQAQALQLATVQEAHARALLAS